MKIGFQSIKNIYIYFVDSLTAGPRTMFDLAFYK